WSFQFSASKKSNAPKTPREQSFRPPVPASPLPPEKSLTVAKKISNKDAAISAAGTNKEEEDGGYESCPDMTPEQLAKIANESPAK
ncbi:unnamed protein product, partial [Thelazia callipaeda]|uniref:Calpastatin n=1 Tax=Thelazia callipaeda TaxID=103827 RepID=A0A0N5CYN9_THECL